MNSEELVDSEKSRLAFAIGNANDELGEKKIVSALLLLLFGSLFSVSKVG